MTGPPNLRDVECCYQCAHWIEDSSECSIHHCSTRADQVCDDLYGFGEEKG